MKIGIGHLALRCFLVGFRDGIEKVNDLKGCTVQQVWMRLLSIKDPNFVYRDVLTMVTNIEKVDVKECLRYALTAQMLVIYLDKYTSYFNDLLTDYAEIMSSKDDWKHLAAGVIMRHIGQVVSNYLFEKKLTKAVIVLVYYVSTRTILMTEFQICSP